MTFGLVVIATVILCQAEAREGAERARAAWVAVQGVDVVAEPADNAFVTMRVARGTRVDVVEEGPDGWLTILPPSGAFSWIERSAIEEMENDRARVTARAAAVRPGREGASMPAGVWTIVRRSAIVRLLDQPPLVIRQADNVRRVWYAIRPPEGEVRYIHEDSVEWTNSRVLGDSDVDDITPFPFDPPASARQARTRRAASTRASIDPEFFVVGPGSPEPNLSDGFRRSLAQVDSQHRSAISGPLDSWQLEPTRQGYVRLQDLAATPYEVEAVRLRLEQLARQDRAARSAKELRSLIDRSRSRDSELEGLRTTLNQLASGRRASFSAEGLLQTTSTLIDGQRSYVLIGDDGFTAAYVVVPAGINARNYLGSRVGVRGETRYHSQIKARVVNVTELEALDVAP